MAKPVWLAVNLTPLRELNQFSLWYDVRKLQGKGAISYHFALTHLNKSVWQQAHSDFLFKIYIVGTEHCW